MAGASLVKADEFVKLITLACADGASSHGSLGTPSGGSLLQIFSKKVTEREVDAFGYFRSKMEATSRYDFFLEGSTAFSALASDGHAPSSTVYLWGQHSMGSCQRWTDLNDLNTRSDKYFLSINGLLVARIYILYVHIRIFNDAFDKLYLKH